MEFDPLQKILGRKWGRGWGSPATNLGGRYSLKGTTVHDHPLYFWGAFEKCPKFDPTLGGRGFPNYRGIPLPTTPKQWRYLPHRNKLERCNCGALFSLPIPARFCPAVFVRKKNFSENIFFRPNLKAQVAGLMNFGRTEAPALSPSRTAAMG